MLAFLLFVVAAAYSQLLCELLAKYPLVSELHNAYIVRQFVFDYNFQRLNLGWQCESCMHGSLFTQFLRLAISWRHISEGRVPTRLRYGGIFTFIANLSQSLPVKKFWKSVKIWQSYWHNFTATFFMKQCITYNSITVYSPIPQFTRQSHKL